MTAKHRGGRGRRAVNKHETVTISLPPVLKAALDAAVTPEVSRSEVVAELIARYLLTPKPTPVVPGNDRQLAPSLEGNIQPEASVPLQLEQGMNPRQKDLLEWARRVKAQGGPQPDAGQKADVGDSLDLSGLVEVLLSPVPNRSRLSPAQLKLIETVEAGAKLYREGAAGGYVLVMDGQRREQHAGTVNALRKLGIVR